MTLIDARHATYSADDIERGLTALALAGDNSLRASELINIPSSTLRTWRIDHAQRYTEIRQARGPELERLITHEARALAHRYGQLEAAALEQAATKIEDADLRDLSTLFKNASIAKGVNVDKMLTLEGRPTTITEHRTRDQLFAELEREGMIQGTAEEITTDALLTEGDKTNPRELTP